MQRTMLIIVVVRISSFGDATYHETGEDHAERSGACVQDGSPEEDEDVHARLQQGLDASQQQDLLVLEKVNVANLQ